MTQVRLVVALFAALVLAAPAAQATPARGELAAATIAFPAGAELASLGLEAVHRGEAAPALTFEAADVAVQKLGASRAEAGSLYSFEYSHIDERQTYSRARLTLSDGVGEHVVALRASGPVTASLPDARMTGVAGAMLASAQRASSCASADGSQADPEGYCLDVRGAYELAGAAAARLSGDVILLVYGATLDVAGDGRSDTFTSGGRTEADGVRREDAWIAVRAKDVDGTFESALALLYSAWPTLTTSRVAIEGAEGAVEVGSRHYVATDDTLLVSGRLLVTPGPVAPTTDDGYGTLGPQYASSFTTRISGDIESINLNAASAFLDSPAERGLLAGLLAILVAGAVYAWQHISFLAAALYTRLQKPDILDNDVRNRIYDIIRENPGISAREVHRRSEQSWGTVVYHLRQLERHHLVVSRSLGRTRNYYENHGKYRGMEVQLACLQSDRARVLARAIATTPGITQEQLAAASGYPQPTTSYYVRKLKQAGLVEEHREGRYAKYVPNADLPRFIAMSEHAPTVNTAAASGVQA